MIFFFIGLIIGSFLNVIIIRTPKNESIIIPGSHCQKCKKSIPFYYNIPVFSYILLRGRCSNCKNKISIQYIIVEIVTGLIYLLTFSLFSLYEAILLSFIFSILIVLSIIDLFHYLIPLFTIILLYSTIIIKFYVLSTSTISEIILGVIVTSLYLGLPAIIVSYMKNKKTVLGAGDMLLSIFIGAWMGAFNGIICLFMASLLGILITIYRKLMHEKEIKIPFGLCISISFFVLEILKEYLYLNLFI